MRGRVPDLSARGLLAAAALASVPPTNCRRLIGSMKAPLRERSYLGATSFSCGRHHNTDFPWGQLLHLPFGPTFDQHALKHACTIGTRGLYEHLCEPDMQDVPCCTFP